jgi:hypothetical protein
LVDRKHLDPLENLTICVIFLASSQLLKSTDLEIILPLSISVELAVEALSWNTIKGGFLEPSMSIDDSSYLVDWHVGELF